MPQETTRLSEQPSLEASSYVVKINWLACVLFCACNDANVRGGYVMSHETATGKKHLRILALRGFPFFEQNGERKEGNYRGKILAEKRCVLMRFHLLPCLRVGREDKKTAASFQACRSGNSYREKLTA